jgi:hypothetical protein
MNTPARYDTLLPIDARIIDIVPFGGYSTAHIRTL